MLPVYSTYFGLNEAPFNITPDPSFLFQSASHQEALAQLQYGIRTRRGFIVLTGEVGTGKTTLIQALLSQLPESTHTALIFSAISSPIDLLRYVCEEFRLVEPMQGLRDSHDYTYLLNEFLLEKYREGANAVLIIDEAQNLSAEVLESVRLLSNFETTKDKLLQILLVGQPELNDRLNTPQLRQLKQRVSLRHHLRPLSLSECQEYIANRLKLAGGSANIFLIKSIEAIHQYSVGIPRLINVICDNAMISAYALERKEIDPRFIQEVADDLCLTNVAARTTHIRREPTLHADQRSAIRPEVVKQPPVQLVKNSRSFVPTDPSPSPSPVFSVPEGFFTSIREALIDAMGPMGHVVLMEQVKALGGTIDKFPRDKMGHLVESVSREIFDENMRQRFQKNMADGIHNLQRAQNES
jgi:type II secretory pathway predicted ATPase ExeA